jgi:hypothetical protein
MIKTELLEAIRWEDFARCNLAQVRHELERGVGGVGVLNTSMNLNVPKKKKIPEIF